MKISRLISIALIPLLFSCAGTNSYRHPKDKPVIKYTQTEVLVFLHNPEISSVRPGEPVTLYSNVHGRIGLGYIGKDLKNFSIFNGNKNVQPNMARIPLPQNAPSHSEDVCFYVKDIRGNVLSAKYSSQLSNKNERGFTNREWQNTFAIQGRISGTATKITKLEQQLARLNGKIDNARQYVAQTDLIQDNVCIMPPHRTPKPLPPFSKQYQAYSELIPHGLCLKANVKGLSVGAKYRLVDKTTNTWLNQNQQPLQNTVDFINAQLNNGNAENAFPHLVNQIFQQHYATTTCSGYNCEIISELQSSSKHRPYKQAYNACINSVKNEIVKKKKEFALNHENWKRAPAKEKHLCDTNLRLFNTGESQLAKLVTEKNNLEAQLAKLKQQRPNRISGFQAQTFASKTTCSI